MSELCTCYCKTTRRKSFIAIFSDVSDKNSFNTYVLCYFNTLCISIFRILKNYSDINHSFFRNNFHVDIFFVYVVEIVVLNTDYTFKIHPLFESSNFFKLNIHTGCYVNLFHAYIQRYIIYIKTVSSQATVWLMIVVVAQWFNKQIAHVLLVSLWKASVGMSMRCNYINCGRIFILGTRYVEESVKESIILENVRIILQQNFKAVNNRRRNVPHYRDRHYIYIHTNFLPTDNCHPCLYLKNLWDTYYFLFIDSCIARYLFNFIWNASCHIFVSPA